MAGREDVFQKAMSEGHSAAWDQQWDKAAAAYPKALEEFPDHPKALSSLGMALFELQRFDESLQVYQKAAQAAPTDPLPLEKVGQLSERLGTYPGSHPVLYEGCRAIYQEPGGGKGARELGTRYPIGFRTCHRPFVSGTWFMNVSVMPNRRPPNT